MTFHLDGLLFVPFGGQRRFGVKVERGGSPAEIVPRRPELDAWFESSPRHTPTCRNLISSETTRIGFVMQALESFNGLEPGHRLTRVLDGGVRVELVNPSRDW